MTWLLIGILCCVAGIARYFEGDNKNNRPFKIGNFYLHCIIFACCSLVAWLTTSSWIVSAGIGFNGAVCIALGQTKWESWKWQILRGSVFSLPLIIYLYASGTPFAWLNVLGICSCFTAAYVVYYGVNKVPAIGKWHFELTCRIVQGFLVCFSSYFMV